MHVSFEQLRTNPISPPRFVGDPSDAFHLNDFFLSAVVSLSRLLFPALHGAKFALQLRTVHMVVHYVRRVYGRVTQ